MDNGALHCALHRPKLWCGGREAPCVILWVVVVVIVGASVGRVSGQHVVHCELNHEDGLYYVRPLLKEWLRTLVIDDEEYYVCHNIDSTEPVYSIYEVAAKEGYFNWVFDGKEMHFSEYHNQLEIGTKHFNLARTYEIIASGEFSSSRASGYRYNFYSGMNDQIVLCYGEDEAYRGRVHRMVESFFRQHFRDIEFVPYESGTIFPTYELQYEDYCCHSGEKVCNLHSSEAFDIEGASIGGTRKGIFRFDRDQVIYYCTRDCGNNWTSEWYFWTIVFITTGVVGTLLPLALFRWGKSTARPLTHTRDVGSTRTAPTRQLQNYSDASDSADLATIVAFAALLFVLCVGELFHASLQVYPALVLAGLEVVNRYVLKAISSMAAMRGDANWVASIMILFSSLVVMCDIMLFFINAYSLLFERDGVRYIDNVAGMVYAAVIVLIAAVVRSAKSRRLAVLDRQDAYREMVSATMDLSGLISSIGIYVTYLALSFVPGVFYGYSEVDLLFGGCDALFVLTFMRIARSMARLSSMHFTSLMKAAQLGSESARTLQLCFLVRIGLNVIDAVCQAFNILIFVDKELPNEYIWFAFGVSITLGLCSMVLVGLSRSFFRPSFPAEMVDGSSKIKPHQK